jgi:hypothetical protein
MCTKSFEYSYNRSKENTSIKPKAGAFDIGYVEPKSIIKFHLGTPDDLPQTS